MRRKGSIDVTKQGRFRARLYLPNGTRPTLGVFETREDAEHAIDSAAIVLTGEAPKLETTVQAYGEIYLTRRELMADVRDAAGDWSRWRNHVEKDAIADHALKTLSTRDVHEWIERTRRKGLARQTVLNVLNLLRGCLSAAVRDGLLKANPALGMTLPREKLTRERWTFLDVAEQTAVLSATPEAIRPIVGVAIGTGIRAGELCALRLADVDAESDRPRLVVRYGGPPTEPTKSGRIRTVPLFGLGLAAMRAWLRGLRAYAPKNPHRVAFPRERGGFRDPDHVFEWHTWKAILETAGITRAFRWHDLRHTCASSLVSGLWGRAWTLEEVKGVLGHTSVTVTERYAHLAGTALDRAAAATPLWPSSGQLLNQEGAGMLMHSPFELGGGEGIRTPGGLTTTAVFKTPDHTKDIAKLARDGQRLARAVLEVADGDDVEALRRRSKALARAVLGRGKVGT